MSSRIAVVGCGPKAAAIAAKAAVLARLGWLVPEVIAIEAVRPAANWDGSNGFTDGRLPLGTTPLEDVAFPYASTFGPEVDREMLAYSYMAYRVDCGDYAEWVDRGQVAPTHAMLADYFRWVVARAELPVVSGLVTRACVDGGRWSVEYMSDGGAEAIRANGLVMTGPGDPVRFAREGLSFDEQSRVLNGQTFWTSAAIFAGMCNVRVAVVGGGETSAAITTYLASVLDQSAHVDVVTRHPIVFTRNENWREVMYFSTAAGWSDLSDEQKIEIIRHADRGTYSVSAKRDLDSAYNVGIELGALTCIESESGKLCLVLSGNGDDRRLIYDYVVEATGFEQASVLTLVDSPLHVSGTPLVDRIDHDLSVRGVDPRLHLPGFAAMAQGPGIPNLSCLGLLSDRILASYISETPQ